MPKNMPSTGAADHVFTVIFFGGANVGITSLVERETFDFTAEYEWGVGIEAYKETVQVEGKKIDLIMFEMGKEKSFDIVSHSVKKGRAGIVMVYDVTNKRSLDELVTIYEHRKAAFADLPILLVGNKIDLEDSRVIGPIEGKRAAQAMNGGFMETSVVDNKNVDKVFHTIAGMILASHGN